MFKLNLKDEDILIKITTTKQITNKEVVTNFIGNLLTSAGGDIASKVNLILTKDILYLEYKGHAAIGYAEETRKIEEINLENLNTFLVTNNENEEVIQIKTDKKEYTFIRDNKNKDNLALGMFNLINDIKNSLF